MSISSLNKNDIAKIHHRILALLIDFVILATILLTLKLTVPELISKKTYKLIPPIVFIVYKPLMEYIFGRSIGKIIFNLKIVTYQYKNPTLKQIIIRNFFPTLQFSLKLYVLLFLKSRLERKSFMIHESVFEINSHQQAISFAFICFYILDFLVLISNEYNKSLHDIIAKTLVINTSSK